MAGRSEVKAIMGTVPGCVFAGVLIASAWFLLSRYPSGTSSRRYASGWSILAIVVGIGIEGMHGWMQWPSWSLGNFQLSFNPAVIDSVNPFYGYIWTFVAAVPWSGMGAVLLAWAGSRIPLKTKDWILRICFGVVGYLIAIGLFYLFPQVFLPLYNQLDQYNSTLCPNCHRAYSDNFLAMEWFGAYIGFLCYEIFSQRFDNVKLILIVGLTSGICWMLCRPLNYLLALGPSTGFNFWRVSETSSGFGIGLGYTLGFIFCNQATKLTDNAIMPPPRKHPNSEVFFGVYFPLIAGAFWGVYCGIGGFMSFFNYTESSFISITICTILLCLLFMVFVFIKMKSTLRIQAESNFKLPSFESILANFLDYLYFSISRRNFGYWECVEFGKN